MRRNWKKILASVLLAAALSCEPVFAQEAESSAALTTAESDAQSIADSSVMPCEIATIPEEYLEECSHAGRIERLDYTAGVYGSETESTCSTAPEAPQNGCWETGQRTSRGQCAACWTT